MYLDSVTSMATLSSPTQLVVVRGNSASGKTSVAAGLRERYGRGIALVSQDVLRREVLRERDIPATSTLTSTIDRVMHASGLTVRAEERICSRSPAYVRACDGDAQE